MLLSYLCSALPWWLLSPLACGSTTLLALVAKNKSGYSGSSRIVWVRKCLIYPGILRQLYPFS